MQVKMDKPNIQLLFRLLITATGEMTKLIDLQIYK